MALTDYDEALGVRIFEGMTKRLMLLGLIWIVGIALPRPTSFHVTFVAVALAAFFATGISLATTSRRSAEDHVNFSRVAVTNLLAYTAITAVYIERDYANSPAVLLFAVPIIYEAVARRGPVFFALPMVLGLFGYVGGSIYIGTRLQYVVADTWHVMGFTVIVYLLIAFLVGEARRTASIAHAFARIAGVVANASSSADAMIVAKDDILLLTEATDVWLLEPDDHAEHGGSHVDEIVFPSTGRRLVFTGAPDHERIETIGNLFLMLETRQLVVNQLHEDSTTDPLTGLGNRRILTDRTRGDQESTTTVMLDLDHFKAYNDLHGHRAGDDLLVDFAAVLASCIRTDDVLVRYGGEEFCLVLHCDVPLAEALTARIRDIWSGHHSEVTFSAGICQVSDGETIESAIDRADAALYMAKRSGRNKTTLANA